MTFGLSEHVGQGKDKRRTTITADYILSLELLHLDIITQKDSAVG